MTGLVADSSSNSRRTLIFIVVLVVHAIFIYGLNAGLTDIIKEKILGNLQTVEIAQPKEEEDKPPPPPPKLETPPPFVPPPELAIETAPVENTTAIQQVTTTKPVEAPPPVVQRTVVETMPKQDPRHPLRPSEDFYPSASKRAGEEGSVDVVVHVTADGRVDDVKVLKSSGFPRLDEGALTYAKTWRLLPGTHDGKPVAMNWQARIVFKLKS